MATAPTGEFSLLLANLTTLIAKSASFRTGCGITTGTEAAKQAAAEARVYWPGHALPDPAVRPFAWIRLGDGGEFVGDDTGGAGFYPRMRLRVLFEKDASTDDEAKERHVKFWNWVGAVVAEMQALAKTAGYLEVTGMTLTDAVMSDPREKEAFDQAEFELRIF